MDSKWGCIWLKGDVRWLSHHSLQRLMEADIKSTGCIVLQNPFLKFSTIFMSWLEWNAGQVGWWILMEGQPHVARPSVSVVVALVVTLLMGKSGEIRSRSFIAVADK